MPEHKTTPAPKPAATVVMFIYDEKPTLTLFTSILRDYRYWPNLALWFQTKDAYIIRSRSTAATRFLEQGNGDVLVMLDHDIGWAEGDLQYLIEKCLETKGIVGGIYPFRDFGRGVPIRFAPGTTITMGEDTLQEVEYVGTGFMAIHREVLEQIAQTVPLTIHGYRPFFIDPEGLQLSMGEDGKYEYELLSEDYAFCKRAQQLGIKIYAATRPDLTHTGSYTYRMVDGLVQLPPTRNIQIVSADHHVPVILNVPVGDTPKTMYIDPADKVVSDHVLKKMPWEPEVTAILHSCAKAGARSLWDLGAHIGYHTIMESDYYQTIIAVEPMPDTYKLLKKNIKLMTTADDGINACVIPFDVALVSRDSVGTVGTVSMTKDYRNTGASHLSTKGALGIEVAARDLDSCHFETFSGKPDVIKIDLEGAEYMVLKDADSWQHAKVIVFEYCDGQLIDVSNVPGHVLIDMFRDRGYEVYFSDCQTLVEDRDPRLPSGRAYCNLVAIRPDCDWLRTPEPEPA